MELIAHVLGLIGSFVEVIVVTENEKRLRRSCFREANSELHLIAAIPYPDFCARWSSDWKRRYDALLEKADLIKYICPSYNAGAYQRRNEWMVDHSAHVIAVFNGEKSGTKNTIDYARKCEIEIEIIQA